MLVCMNCFEIFKSRLQEKQCPRSICAGKLVSVDELIVPAIVELNRKGYLTEGCCSMHPLNAIPTTDQDRVYGSGKIWIHFVPGIDDHLGPMPNYFQSHTFPSGVTRIESTGFSDEQKENFVIFYSNILTRLSVLTSWAFELPKLPEDVIKKLRETEKQKYIKSFKEEIK